MFVSRSRKVRALHLSGPVQVLSRAVFCAKTNLLLESSYDNPDLVVITDTTNINR